MAEPANSAILEFDRRNQEMADWRSMEQRVLPGVRSMSDYRVNSTQGLVNATLELRRDVPPPPNPTASELLHAHKVAYGTCVKDAGAFRKPGEFATFGGHNGAESQRIGVEFERLRAEMGEMLAHAKTDQQKCAAIAFYHGRFIAILPFMDGNGRLGRAIMASQVEKILGRSPRPLMSAIADNKPAYVKAHDAALKGNDLGPLTKLIAESLAIEPPAQATIPSPSKIACRRMMSLSDVKPMAEERALASTGAGLPLAEQKSPEPANDAKFGQAGVPFTVISPLRGRGKDTPEEALARVRQEATLCQSYFVQMHTSDGQVYDSPVHGLARNLAEWQARDPALAAKLGTAITVGFTAKDHQALVARCNADGKPFPSAFADVQNDRRLTASDPRHQPRYLDPEELRTCILAGSISRLDPQDLAHRMHELYQIGGAMDKNRAALSSLCREVAKHRQSPGKSVAPGTLAPASGSLLLDRMVGMLEAPARAPGDLTSALEAHYSMEGSLDASARDGVIAGSYARTKDGKRATAPSVAAAIEQSFVTWKAQPENKRRSTADFLVEHMAGCMTAAGVRGLGNQLDPADRRRYDKSLSCEHPALDLARSLPARPPVNALLPEAARTAVLDETMKARGFLHKAFGGPEQVREAFGLKPGQTSVDVATHMVRTREVWMQRSQVVSNPGTNSEFLAGYMEKHLQPVAKEAYLEAMSPPMRRWHDNRVAHMAETPGHAMPDNGGPALPLQRAPAKGPDMG